MSKLKAPRKLLPFDAARYLTDDAAIAEYMTAVLELDDPALLLLALGDAARARAGYNRMSCWNRNEYRSI